MTANERLLGLMLRCGVDMAEMPEGEARDRRCAAFAAHAYRSVTGKETDGRDVTSGELISAMAQYGVHLVDLVDRLEWALDNALTANGLMTKLTERLPGMRRTKAKLARIAERAPEESPVTEKRRSVSQAAEP